MEHIRRDPDRVAIYRDASCLACFAHGRLWTITTGEGCFDNPERDEIIEAAARLHMKEVKSRKYKLGFTKRYGPKRWACTHMPYTDWSRPKRLSYRCGKPRK